MAENSPKMQLSTEIPAAHLFEPWPAWTFVNGPKLAYVPFVQSVINFRRVNFGTDGICEKCLSVYMFIQLGKSKCAEKFFSVILNEPRTRKKAILLLHYKGETFKKFRKRGFHHQDIKTVCKRMTAWIYLVNCWSKKKTLHRFSLITLFYVIFRKYITTAKKMKQTSQENN